MADDAQYFKSDSFQRMLEAYEESKKTGTPVFLDSDEYADIAEYYYNTGNTQVALDVAEEAINMFPGAAAPLVFKARYVLLSEQNTEKADFICEQISDKSDLDYYYVKAEILIVEDKVEEAHQYLKSNLDQINEDDYEDYILDVATLFIDYEQDVYADLWIHMSKAGQTDEHLEILGRIFICQGKYNEAECTFNKLLDKSPYTIEYWSYLNICQRLNNKFDDAISSCEYALAVDPQNSDTILNIANTYLHMGNFEKSLPYYEQYNNLRSNDDVGEAYYGIALSRLNRNDEAEKHLKMAEQLTFPKSSLMSTICQELAFVLSRKGNVDEALDYIDKGIESGIYESSGDILKGHIMLQHSAEEHAKFWFKKARRDAHEGDEISLQICTSYYDNGYYDSAYKLFKNLSEECLNAHPEVYAFMADCCRHLNRRRPYLFNLEKACKLAPQETKNVLGKYYPEEMSPANYFNFENLWHSF